MNKLKIKETLLLPIEALDLIKTLQQNYQTLGKDFLRQQAGPHAK